VACARSRATAYYCVPGTTTTPTSSWIWSHAGRSCASSARIRYGLLVGNLLLKPVPLSAGESSGGPNDVEIGWHLHPDAWGQGYATEAAQAVLHDGFGRGLAKVLAVTDPDNHASQAVCRRLGMTALGRTTKYYDTVNELFEILPRSRVAPGLSSR
jgi:RimJ/RimL family protein N-acetyltransferase